MNLYDLTTKISGFQNTCKNIYVVADDPTSAQKLVKEVLSKRDTQYPENREVINIRLIAKEVTRYINGEPIFSEEGINLLIQGKNYEV